MAFYLRVVLVDAWNPASAGTPVGRRHPFRKASAVGWGGALGGLPPFGGPPAGNEPPFGGAPLPDLVGNLTPCLERHLVYFWSVAVLNPPPPPLAVLFVVEPPPPPPHPATIIPAKPSIATRVRIFMLFRPSVRLSLRSCRGSLSAAREGGKATATATAAPDAADAGVRRRARCRVRQWLGHGCEHHALTFGQAAGDLRPRLADHPDANLHLTGARAIDHGHRPSGSLATTVDVGTASAEVACFVMMEIVAVPPLRSSALGFASAT